MVNKKAVWVSLLALTLTGAVGITPLLANAEETPESKVSEISTAAEVRVQTEKAADAEYEMLEEVSLGEEEKGLYQQIDELYDKQENVFEEHSELWNRIDESTDKIYGLLYQYNIKFDNVFGTSDGIFDVSYINALETLSEEEKEILLSDIEKLNEWENQGNELSRQIEEPKNR